MSCRLCHMSSNKQYESTFSVASKRSDAGIASLFLSLSVYVRANWGGTLSMMLTSEPHIELSKKKSVSQWDHKERYRFCQF